PAASRVLRGGGSECCSCRIVVARQSLGDALKITEVGPFIAVLGVFPQFDKGSASRLVVAVLKCGNGLSGKDRRRGADRGPSRNRRWQHSGWIGGGGNPACGVGRLGQARSRACNNHKRKSSPQEGSASSRHHANARPAISWCHEKILPKQGLLTRSKEFGRSYVGLDGSQKAQARRQEEGPALLLESKPACRSRLIGRWHGGLGSPAMGWPRHPAGQFEYRFRLSLENNVGKAFFFNDPKYG